MGRASTTALEKDDLTNDFLQKHGWAEATSAPLPGDFSARAYLRLSRKKGTPSKALLMRMPQAQELPPFVLMQRLLAGAGARVPEIYVADETSGLALIEDLGTRRFDEFIEQGGEDELYRLATDVLLHLHREKARIIFAPEAKKFTADVFLDQACLLPEILALDVSAFRKAWGNALEMACEMPAGLMLRDYHAANIMILEHEHLHRRAALIDFQDGGLGPLPYDLASLLEDARRDVPDDLRREMIDYYLSKNASIPRDEFLRSYAILAAQRHVRVTAVLIRRWRETKDTNIKSYLARTLNLLSNHKAQPALKNLFTWWKAHMPKSLLEKEGL
jgi:aminoglycoside/choline kinase family phosphotransferase